MTTPDNRSTPDCQGLRNQRPGGILQTYQKYDPQKFPSPTRPAADVVSPFMEQMLMYGSHRGLTEDELARAVYLDPQQFAQLGPGLDQIKKMLLDRKRRILEKYETDEVKRSAAKEFRTAAGDGQTAHPDSVEVPEQLRDKYRKAVNREQIYELERLWFAVGDDASPLARHLARLMGHLENKYEIDELAAKYAFVGRQSMTIPEALEVKEELEKIDELLEQLEQAMETAQIAVLDLEQLGEFVPEADMQSLEELKRHIENHVREAAERQGLERDGHGRFRLTPKAYKTFQSKLLGKIFSSLQASRTGRHRDEAVIGEGAVELPQTKAYEFGDSLTQMDIPQSFVNAMLRQAGEEGQATSPVRLKPEDIEVHRTRNTQKCATMVIMDMSGSMRYDGQYMNVKRMALALDGLVRSEFPGDFLGFVEMYSFAKLRRPGEIVDLMPKPVTVHDPVVQLSVDMSNPDVSEHMVHQHFTNIQHSLRLSRQVLANQPTPNRQVVLITDGLPTAHFEDSRLFLLYPPHPLTEQATMREAQLCQREGITINIFLVPSWSQSEEDIRFAHRMAESTKGRVFFTSGNDLDRFVVWDYVKRNREIL